ncbi:MAG: hypothetical protein K9N21_02325 [Deltaproteobacteria bacterium]|nr:hypothetical protein [Deltaproteobacteria bacterium]
MKKLRTAILFVIGLSLFTSGCKWSILSVTGPTGVSSGQTIVINISGFSEGEAESPTQYGLILQLPESWVVESATATVSSSTYNLVENTEYAALYSSEPGYKIWVGTATEPSSSTNPGTATVQISVGDCPGQGQIKAASGSYRNGAWVTDDPLGQFDFGNITEQKYIHSFDCCTWRRQDTPSPLNHLKGVWGNSASDVFAVGVNGTILHYNGTAWSSMTSGTTSTLNGVWGSSGTFVFCVGANGTILHYNGAVWTSMDSDTTSNLNGVWGKAGFGVLAVGDNQNTITQYTGSNWISKTLPGACSSTELFGIWGSASDDIFAVGNLRSFFRSDGYHWSCSQLYGGDMYGIWGSSGSDVFAVGAYINEFWDDHPIAHYDGSSWSAMANDTTNGLYGVWGSSASNVFAVGANGTILYYDGNAWNSISSDTTNTLRAVWGSSDTDVFAVGNNGTIIHYGPPISLYVDIEEQCGGLAPCYPTIQAAINAAKNWDAIKVKEGNYKEFPTNAMPVTVTISGGWNNTFTERTGTTEIYAPRATGGGTLKVQPNIKVVAPQ